MVDIKTNIANSLRFFRTQNGISQKDLAEKLSVAPNTVSEWEKAKYTPNADTLVAICDIFKISLDDIYGISHKKNTPVTSIRSDQRKFIDMLEKLTDKQKSIVEGMIMGFVKENAAAEAEAAKQTTNAG